MSGSFFDSNVILYFTQSPSAKSDRAKQLFEHGGMISTQVLNECANVMRRKQSKSWSDIRAFIERLRVGLDVLPLTVDIHHTGLRLAERYGFAVYDSFIVAAALIANCETLWSEDMQHGLFVDGRLRIQNPFAA